MQKTALDDRLRHAKPDYIQLDKAKLVSRIIQASNEAPHQRKSRWTIKPRILFSATIAAIALLIGVPAFAGTNLVNIITGFLHLSGGNQSGATDIQFTGKTSTAFDMLATASMDSGTGFTTKMDNFVGMPFPKIQSKNMTYVDASISRYPGGHIGITGQGEINGQINNQFLYGAWRKLTKSIHIDGSTAPSTSTVLLQNGTPATYLKFSYGHPAFRYLIWHQGDWTVVLGAQVSKSALMTMVNQIDSEVVH